MTRTHAQYSSYRSLLTATLIILVGLVTAQDAEAQRAPGSVGVGLQLGEPSGLSVKVYNPQSVSYDFLAAYDLNEFFYVNGHGTYEAHLGSSSNAHAFFGPGAFLGVRDNEGDADDDVEAGLSATAGLSYVISRVELYARVTPRLALTPATEGDLGGGFGIRYYFR